MIYQHFNLQNTLSNLGRREVFTIPREWDFVKAPYLSFRRSAAQQTTQKSMY